MDYARLAIVLALSLPACVNGLKCYSCQSVGDLDPRCETSPTDVASVNPVISCNMKYCTIKRVEYYEPKGRLRSIQRSCEERPLYTNKIVTILDQSVTYYTACQTDMCNGGLGVDVGSGGSGGWLEDGGGSAGGGGIIVAPGVGGSAGLKSSINYAVIWVLALLGLILYG